MPTDHDIEPPGYMVGGLLVGIPCFLALIFLRLGDADVVQVGLFAAIGLFLALTAWPAWRTSRARALISNLLRIRRDERGRRDERSEWLAAMGFLLAAAMSAGLLVLLSLVTEGPLHRVALGFGAPLFAWFALLAGIGVMTRLGWN